MYFGEETVKRILRPILPRRLRERLWFINQSLKIHLSGGRCLRAMHLKLRPDPHKYDSMFQESEKNFRATVEPYLDEFRWPVGRMYPGSGFDSIDIECYYSMIRNSRPDTLIEVGSGNSTWFAVKALKRNGRGRLIAIDPDPAYTLGRDVAHISRRVEDVDPEIFSNLDEKDILFMDSSHSRDEAVYHIENILPRLKSGVILHYHDVLYPYVSYFEEEDLILDFFYQNPDSFQVLFGVAYIWHHSKDLIRELIKSFAWNENKTGASIWIKRK
jgi:hypothetical protein